MNIVSDMQLHHFNSQLTIVMAAVDEKVSISSHMKVIEWIYTLIQNVVSRHLIHAGVCQDHLMLTHTHQDSLDD